MKIILFKKTILFIIIFPILISIFHKPVFAKTYYVAKDGNDSSAGIESQPWRTIQKAANTLVAGDTVLVKGGTYNERVIPRNSGSSGNYITFTSYPGDTVIIDGGGTGGNLFHIQGKSYIKVAGLTLRNSSDKGVYVSKISVPEVKSEHIILSGLKIENSRVAGILVNGANEIMIEKNFIKDVSLSSGIGVWRSTNVIVDGNTIINAHQKSQAEGGHNECLTISGVTNFEVRNNTVGFDEKGVNQFGALGIDVKESSSFGKVYRNYVYKITASNAGIYIDAWKAGLNNTPTLHNIEIYENRVDLSAHGINISSEAGGTVDNIKVYNNLLTRLGNIGIGIAGHGGNGPRKNIYLFNNTIYKSWSNGGAGIYIKSENIENIIIRNNIVSFGPGTVGEITAISDKALSKVTADHNLVFGPEKCSQDYPYCKEISTSIRADPKFVDPAGNNFHLRSDSPAIDAGVNLTLQGITKDFEEKSRPQGVAFDIGAYEFGSTTTSPAPTSIPTNTPSPGSSSCPLKSSGDANCDGLINGIDYSIWLNSQCRKTTTQSCASTVADFNSDGNVDDTDYQIWYGNRG